MSEWIVRETDKQAPADLDNLGSKILVGNGYLGYRGTLDEFTKEHKTATIVSGLYDRGREAVCRYSLHWRHPSSG